MKHTDSCKVVKSDRARRGSETVEPKMLTESVRRSFVVPLGLCRLQDSRLLNISALLDVDFMRRLYNIFNSCSREIYDKRPIRCDVPQCLCSHVTSQQLGVASQ